MGRKKLRDMTYDDYGISQERYRELLYFCRQYKEKKSKIKYGLSSPAFDGMPHGSGVGTPTERMAVQNSPYIRDVEMIEESAKEAHPVLGPFILRNVTEGIRYEELGKVPICRKDFHAYRRKFFGILHQKRCPPRALGNVI